MWLFFSILSPVLWALGNVNDSALRRHFMKNDFVLTLAFALMRLPVALVLLVIFGEGLVFGWPVVAMSIAGILWVLPFVLYYKALEFEETSRVILIIQFLPVFILILAAILIGERLDAHQLIAFVLILAGSVMAAVKKIESGWRFSKAFVLIVLASLGWALADVIFKKYAVYFSSFWQAFAVDIFASSLFGLILFILPRFKNDVRSFCKFPVKGWTLFLISAVAGTIGSLAFSYALTLGKASLTAVIVGIQPLVVFVFAYMLNKIVKEIPKESLTKRDLLLKGFSLILICAGLYYLYLM